MVDRRQKRDGLLRGEVLDAHHRVADGHVLAGLRHAARDDAADGGDDRRVREVLAGDAQRRLRLLHLARRQLHAGLRDVLRRLGLRAMDVARFEFVVAHLALLVQPLVAGEVEERLLRLGLGLHRLRARHVERRPRDVQILLGDRRRLREAGRIDLEERGLAGLDPIAFVHRDAVEVARDARGDVRDDFALDGALHGQPPLERPALRRLRAHGNGRGFRRGFSSGLLLPASCRHGRDGRRQKHRLDRLHVVFLKVFRCFKASS